MPGPLAAKMITSASATSANANHRSCGREYATMMPWLNQNSANTEDQ